MGDKQRYIHVFDKVPLVPVNDFKKLNFDMRDAWHLVGPTIQRNMRFCNAQQLYCVAFIEGMRMARFALKEPSND